MYIKKTELKDFLVNRLSELTSTLTEHPLIMDGNPVHVLGRDCIIQGPPIPCKEYSDLIKGFRAWDVVWDGEVIVNLYEHMIGHTANVIRRWQMIHPADHIEESILFSSKWVFRGSADYTRDWKTGHAHLITILNYFVIRASLLRVNKVLNKNRYALFINKGELPANPLVHQHIPVAKIQLLEELPSFITDKIENFSGRLSKDYVAEKLYSTHIDETSTALTLSSKEGVPLLALLYESLELFNEAFESLQTWYKENVSMALSVLYQGESKPTVIYVDKEKAPIFADGFLFYRDALTHKVVSINVMQIKTITPHWCDDNWKESKLQEILRK